MERLAQISTHLLRREQPNTMAATTTGIVAAAAAAASCSSSPDDIFCLDYAYSFITHPGPNNAVRFWVEARTIIYDDRAGTKAIAYQCARYESCNCAEPLLLLQLLLRRLLLLLLLLPPQQQLLLRRGGT